MLVDDSPFFTPPSCKLRFGLDSGVVILEVGCDVLRVGIEDEDILGG